LGGDSPPRSWARGGETYNWRAAAPNLLVFVITAPCTMFCQDLTTGLAPTQHPCMQPHYTPTSSPPTSLHPIAISVLAINSLSRARYWASSRQPLRTERPFSSTQPTPLTLAHTQPPHALAMYTKGPWLYPLLPSPKSVRLWGVHWHRTGWRLVVVPFRSPLQTG